MRLINWGQVDQVERDLFVVLWKSNIQETENIENPKDELKRQSVQAKKNIFEVSEKETFFFSFRKSPGRSYKRILIV